MRILHAYSSFHPKRGGVPVAVASLAQAQREAGADARLVSLDSAADAEVDALFLARGWTELPHRRLPGLRRGMRAIPLPTTAAFRVLDEVDVLHIHGVWEPLGLMLAALARVRGIPYGVAPHGMLAPWSIAHRPWRKQVALRVAYNRFLSNASFVHFLNAPERDEIGPGVELPRVRELLPNGVFERDFAHLPNRGDFRSAHPEMRDKQLVLFLGRLHLQKGLLVLADAFELVAAQREDVDLVVAGPDEGGCAPFVERIAHRGLTGRVHVVGPLYSDEKWRALVGCDVFCLPSYQEAFSVAVTEALACGLPCVVSRQAHYPVIAEIDAGRVVELSSEAVAEGLLEVLTDEQQRADMGQRAATHVRRHLTWERIASQSLKMYRRVL